MRYRIWSARVLSVAMPLLMLVVSPALGQICTKHQKTSVSMPCQDAHWAGCQTHPLSTRPPWLMRLLPKKRPPLANEANLSQEEQIDLYVDGRQIVVSKRTALIHGYTIIDLSDGWVPSILGQEKSALKRQPLGYRKRFRDLANDRTDRDGVPLAKGEHNYLEVYGISPSLSVLKARFESPANAQCQAQVNYAAIRAAGRLPYKYGQRENTPLIRYRALRRLLQGIAKKRGHTDLENLEKLVKGNKWMGRQVARYRRLQRQALGFEAIEKRLTCAGLLRPRERHREGRVDYALVRGLQRFWRKNRLFESWGFSPVTMAHLAKTPTALNFEAFRRVVRERIIFASGIIEDGSAGLVEYRDDGGRWRVAGNLTEQYVDSTLGALGIKDAESAKAFLNSRTLSDLSHLRIAVKLPKKPAYYNSRMNLRLVIDRGTVWYDYPWRPNGRRKRQRRERMPTVTLITRYQGQDIPLVRWPTTIGGWHAETNGTSSEFMRYKNSDVGHRVIRNVIAAPVWLPPKSTPARTLVAYRREGRQRQWQLKTELMGPGHLSAYGLVAGYLVIPGKEGRRDYDRGIRIHGSSNYLSITRKTAFSHGCHRMRNDQVMRLFGFILAHRAHRVEGETPYAFRREFQAQGKAFKFEIKNRGFKYTLTPPLSVEVTEGEIKGRRKKPWKGRFPIPRKRRTMALN